MGREWQEQNETVKLHALDRPGGFFDRTWHAKHPGVPRPPIQGRPAHRPPLRRSAIVTPVLATIPTAVNAVAEVVGV